MAGARVRKRRRFDATVLLSPAARKVKVPGRRSSAFSSSLFPLFSVRLLLLQNTFTRCACYFFLSFFLGADRRALDLQQSDLWRQRQQAVRSLLPLHWTFHNVDSFRFSPLAPIPSLFKKPWDHLQCTEPLESLHPKSSCVHHLLSDYSAGIGKQFCLKARASTGWIK